MRRIEFRIGRAGVRRCIRRLNWGLCRKCIITGYGLSCIIRFF